MKKNFEQKSEIEIENKVKDIYSNQQTKTTNVNILLNRVRLDKKKAFKKRLISSFIILSLISLFVSYFIL
tara:strand:+ start:360 stop:569 length:210 start_codon:yes stop_codon:yes gene_type:complete